MASAEALRQAAPVNVAAIMASPAYQTWAHDRQPGQPREVTGWELLGRMDGYQLSAMHAWLIAANDKLGWLVFESGEIRHGTPEWDSIRECMGELLELSQDNVQARTRKREIGRGEPS